MVTGGGEGLALDEGERLAEGESDDEGERLGDEDELGELDAELDGEMDGLGLVLKLGDCEGEPMTATPPPKSSAIVKVNPGGLTCNCNPICPASL